MMRMITDPKTAGSYLNKNTNTYELWAEIDGEAQCVGTASADLPKEQRTEIEKTLWNEALGLKP